MSGDLPSYAGTGSACSGRSFPGLLECQPDFLRLEWHINCFYAKGSQRIQNRVHQSRWGAYTACFTSAFGTQGIEWRRCFNLASHEHREIFRPGHGVIHKGACEQLSLITVKYLLKKRLSNAL